MALDFPSNPTNGQVYDNFYYDAVKGTWKSLSSGASPNYLVNPTITNAVISATASTSATVPLTVNGAVSQSANLQEWKNSNGVIRASVDPDGKLFANGGLQTLYIGNNADTGAARIDMDASGTLVSTNTGSTIGLRVRNTKAGFTSDLQQWQNESGTVLAKVDSVGRISTINQPRFLAKRSGNLTGYNPSNQSNVIVFNNALSNVGNHYNTSTGKFTAPISGVYSFTVGVYQSVNVVQLWPVVNGLRGETFSIVPSSANMPGSFTQYLSAGDNIGVLAWSDGNTNVTVYDNAFHTYFGGYLVA